MKEVWKPIPGYEEFCEASNMGRVRSVNRVVEKISKYGRTYKSKLSGRVLRPRIATNGYARYNLPGRRDVNAQRIVAMTFIPNPLNKEQVNHKNCDKLDNKVKNLEWVTKRENYDHAIINGRYKQSIK